MVTYEHGYMKLSPTLTRLLSECTGEDTGRYAINAIQVRADGFVATDGRRLIIIKRKNKSKKTRLCLLTKDGYVLPADDIGEFPNWQDTVLGEKDRLLVAKGVFIGDNGRSIIAYELAQHQICVGQDLLEPVLKQLRCLGAIVQEVWCSKENAATRVFMLEGDCDGGSYTYVQMPVYYPV